MPANWAYTPYDTPVFGILVASGVAWLLAFIWGIARPIWRTKAIMLQFGINTQIGVLSAFAYIWGMNTTVEASYAAGQYPESRTMLPYEKIPMFDPYLLLGDMRFYYQISEIYMWIYGVTFILTMFGILLHWPQTKKAESGPRE